MRKFENTHVRRATRWLRNAGEQLRAFVYEGKAERADALAAQLDELADFLNGYTARVRAAATTARETVAPMHAERRKGDGLRDVIRAQSERLDEFVRQVRQRQGALDGALEEHRRVAGIGLGAAEAEAMRGVERARAELQDAQRNLAALWIGRVEARAELQGNAPRLAELRQACVPAQRAARAAVEGWPVDTAPVVMESRPAPVLSDRAALIHARNAVEAADAVLSELRPIASAVDGLLDVQLTDAEAMAREARAHYERIMKRLRLAAAKQLVDERKAELERVKNYRDEPRRVAVQEALDKAEREHARLAAQLGSAR